MVVSVQNMVCARCEMLLTQRAEEAGLPVKDIKIGQMEFTRDLTEAELSDLDAVLETLGFRRLQSKKSKLIERLKNIALEWVKTGQQSSPYTWSAHLAEQMGMEYTYLTHLFSQETGNTLENYIISIRIELAKDLLRNENLLMTDIASQLGYSSLAHFSNQFKKEMGMTPTEYRNAPSETKALDTL